MTRITKNLANVAKAVCIVAASFSLISLAASERAEAADGYSVSVWHNDSLYVVRGQYRWGNGPWQNFEVPPGRQFATWLTQSAGIQNLQVRFDADPGPGYDTVVYRLRTYYNPTTVFANGATERFIVLANGRVDLRNTRA